MKDFSTLNERLQGLVYNMDGDFWLDMLAGIRPPDDFPEEQAVLDMVYRDAKALAGYIPDLMQLMQKLRPKELSEAEKKALLSVFGLLNLAARYLVMIVIIPRYHDHEDLINTLNGYRQTLAYVRDYLALA